MTVKKAKHLCENDCNSVIIIMSDFFSDWINEISDMEEKEICTLSWHNISVFVKENHSTIHRVKTLFDKKNELKSRILDNVSGMVHSGQLLALIGPSGAGKTTLLNILTSRKMQNLDVSGTVVLNNAIVDNESVRSVSSYVQQNDFFIGTLTVKEHLIFSAEMRMPNRSKAERRSKIEQLLRELGLDKCKDSLIGQLGESGISGGERKRLSFACELLSDPMIMFCDEPTSGLDSFMAQQVVSVLQQAANNGKMIICTIHQPSSQVFAMFDQLCLLAQGQVAYFGLRKEALEIFERCRLPCPVNFSPSDHYIRCLSMKQKHDKECERKIQMICSTYRDSKNYSTLEKYLVSQERRATTSANKSINKLMVASRFTQLIYLLWRSMISALREPRLTRIRYSETLIAAIINGLVFYQLPMIAENMATYKGLIFQITTNMTYLYVFGVLEIFCTELPVFYQEYGKGLYRIETYYFSKIFSELRCYTLDFFLDKAESLQLPSYIALPFLYCTIVYWMSGYLCSAISGDLSVANPLLNVIIISLWLVSGYYIAEDSIPPYFAWLKYFSFVRYSYQALSINQWQNIESIPGCSSNSTSTCISNGEDVLVSLNFSAETLLLNILILLVFTCAVQLIGLLALTIRTKLHAE